MNEFIITHALSTYEHPSLHLNFYDLFSRKSREWAKEQSRALAEGPTHLIRNNYYGPVELWPLVWRGECFSKERNFYRMQLVIKYTVGVVMLRTLDQ